MRHTLPPARPACGRFVFRITSAAFLLAAVQLHGPASAQPADVPEEAPPRPLFVQAGVTVGPTVGFQGGYVGLFSRVTTEGMASISVTEDVRLTGRGGLGVRLLRPSDGGPPRSFNVDVGLRAGVRFNSGADVRLRPSLSPFLRVLFGLPGARTGFLEVGAPEPVLRAGFWLRRS